jgi:class 3 adenylate cyclase/tetratricopeptide (TPR) repeat protein
MPTCSHCGQENPDIAKFCLACATPLAKAPSSGAEERKVVTVLFCDLVGFTAASEAADPEDVRARIRPYHARLRQEIEGYGGTVEKFIGDAVMAVFGAPVAHEDDPERAVRAGLRILEAIQELNEGAPGLELSVRIGINTGKAVVALGARPELGEGMVTGDVVNTASRLQGVAPVGGIVVGEGTYRATKPVFEYHALQAVAVKGKAEPVPVWEALAARARFGVDVTRTHETPLVGRELELRLLTDTFERAVRDSSAQLVTVVGEPGVGKSRLVAELFTHIDSLSDLITWRQGRSLPYGEGITFWALGEIVKAQAGILESDPPEVADAKLAECVQVLVPDEAERAWFRSRLGPLVGLESTSSAVREESFAAWRRFLEGVAAAGPMVIVLEDLHWADQPMLEFTEHLVEYATDVPLMVVGTARPELYDRYPGWAGGKRNTTTISLSPLREEDTARLVSALMHQAVLPAETQALLLERAGGNPLYAEEFIRMLTDRGLIDERGRLSGDPSVVPFPEGIQALIAARLDTLAPERKALLYDASVIGKVFWSGAVAAMGNRDEPEVRVGLHELSRKELIRPARVSSVEGEAEYSFWHALVRDVAYVQIPRAQRAERHRKAAAWIEELAGDRVADHAELLAHHFLIAMELLEASGRTADLGPIQESARRYLTMAGDRAMSLDVAKALQRFRSALDLTPEDHPDRPGILAKLAEALYQSAHFEEAETFYREAMEEFRAQGDAIGASDAARGLGAVLGTRGDVAGAGKLFAEAVSELEQLPPSAALARAVVTSAGTHMMAGRYSEAVAEADRAISLARSAGAVELEVRALDFKGASRVSLGDIGGVADQRRALEEALRAGFGRTTVVIYNNLGDSIRFVEGPGSALATFREGIAFAESRGLEEAGTHIRAESIDPLIDLGKWDEGTDVALELVALFKETGDLYGEAFAEGRRAYVLAERGEALDEEHLLTKGREIGDTQILVPILVAVAIAQSMADDTGNAIRLVSEALEVTARGATYTRAGSLTDLVRVAVVSSNLGLAESLQAGVDEPLPRFQHALASARAMLAEARGDLQGALDRYGDAAERWSAFGLVFEHAHALFGQGRCLVALGQSIEAAQPLGEARRVFSGLRASPYVADVDKWLERATALTS